MKKGYLRIIALLIAAYCCLLQSKPAMARQGHHHRTSEEDDSCFRCPPGFGVDRRCTRHHDTECSPCRENYYSAHHSAHRPCYPCSLCGVGLYVAHICTPTTDTVCDSCHTYKGPHNVDFVERCVKPLLSRTNFTYDGDRQWRSAETLTDKSTEVKARPMELPSSIVIVGGVVVGALAVILVATCFIAFSRRRCKTVNSRYPYQAVATQEAVML